MTYHDGDYSQSHTLGDLFEDGRFDEAEQVLGSIARSEPAAGWPLSLRALCLAELKRDEEALAVARAAVRRAPGDAFAHWTVGALLVDRNRLDEAAAEARSAIALEPGDPRHHALAAQVHAKRGEWEQCRAAAEAGLAIDPADEVCGNLRALALRPTDSGSDWRAAVDRLIEQYPASSWARASRGWGLLERGQGTEARAEFEQALALDPTSEWARYGLIESIKAENRFYGALLRLFLWVERLPPRTRWMIILGGLFAVRILRETTEINPSLRVVAWPIIGAWIFLVIASWIGAPLSNFVLMRTRVGRRLVRGADRIAANLVAALLVVAILTGTLAAVSGAERAGLFAMATAFLMIPTGAVFQCMPGWPRTTMAAYTACNAVAVAFVLAPDVQTSGAAFGIALAMSVVGSWIGAFLGTRVPQR
ncbi:MAG TPA: tetratricopeptide repeat protein [Longimicrobiales bacterium]